MKPFITMAFLSILLTACAQPEPQKHLFFYHSRFLENNSLSTPHPTHGKVEYEKILQTFEAAGFQVHSEIRSANTNVREYALQQVPKIDSLIKQGIAPEDITIVGTSKGGYIAQYLSTFLQQ
ncbi:MAG: YqiA/YcfP family alpha/beta fold hydrolase, partial [Bacteroidota bacterium]